MIFATLSAPVFDTLSPLVLRQLASGSLDVDLVRRSAFTATLDGGIVGDDGGYTHGDREVRIRLASVTTAQDAELRRLLTSYSRTVLGLREGVFLASLTGYVLDAGVGSLRVRLVSKLSV